MQLDDLKNTWRQETQGLDSTPQFRQAMSSLEKEIDTFSRHLKWRDWREYIAAFVCIPVFAYAALFKADNWVVTSGYWLLLLSCIAIPLTLYKAKPKDVDKRMGLRSFLEHEKVKVKRQINLLSNVLYWYLAPLYIGIMLVTVGKRIYLAGFAAVDFNLWSYVALVTLICIGIYYMNLKTVNTKYTPMLKRIEQQLSDINA